MSDKGDKGSSYVKGKALERAVAAIYRTLGAKVQHDVSLAGNQIDILVTEQTPSRATIKIAVECKAYSGPVGVNVINTFGAVSYLLKNRGLIDKAVVVSINGYTNQARSAANEHNIELLEQSDLQQRLRGREEEVIRTVEAEFAEEAESRLTKPTEPKRVFVIMPFSKEFDDVYVLGIRDVAERLGLVVERADDIEHNGQILEVVQQSIKECHLAIADTTHLNPNVFYEVGYAHACGTPTILISRIGQELPFDLQSMNHIFYQTIVDLRERLERRIRVSVDVG